MSVQLLIYTIPSIYSLYYRNPLTYIVVYCKIRMFLIQVTNLTYRWSYTIASFDRYVMSSSNVHLRRLASIPIAVRVLVVNITIWIIFSAYILFIYTVQSNSCNIFNNTAATLFTSLYSIILGGIIPTLIMVICTLLTRKNLKEKRIRRQFLINHQQNLTGNEHLQRKRDQQALKMLFAQIFVYIIVTIPWVAFSLNNLISSYIPNKSPDRIAIESFISVVSGSFSFLFPAISFYIYTLTSKMFRDALIRILKSLFLCQILLKNRIEPTATNQNLQRTPFA